MSTLRIGTRGSALALWQAHFVRDRLQLLDPSLHIEIQVITTTGDKILDRPLAEIGGKGLFIKEIEQALYDRAIDLAVHSLKDMPTEQPDGLLLAAYPDRDSPFDVLCAREPGMTLATLPPGARVGTGSLRRGAQLRRLRPDLVVEGLRGNVQTRLSRRVDPAPGLDAVVLAEAGLRRLGIWEDGFSVLRAPDYLPAPAQGALAIEVRSDDDATFERVRALDDPETRLSITAERACLAAIEGDCHTPFAAYAWRDGDGLALHARLLDEDGTSTEGRRMVVLRDDPLQQASELGAVLGRHLLERHRAADERGR